MSNETIGKVHSIESFGAVDGPGIRYVLFLKKCLLRCAYCHNPDTWKEDGATLKYPKEIFEDVLKYKNFIKNGGLTISGGEPLLQAEFCEELIDLCKQSNIHTAIDTSGAVALNKTKNCIQKADMLLLDIKSLDNNLCKKITSMTNENTLETLDFCESIGKRVWIRHVLVPKYTLEKTKLTELAEYLKQFKCVEKVELLAFHKMGEYKWDSLGYNYSLRDIPEPTEQEMEQAKDIFKKAGLTI